MKKMRTLAATVLSVSMCAGLAACGGSSANENTTAAAKADNTTAVAAESPAPDDEPIVLRVLSAQQAENPEGDIERSISDAYTALHPNVTFEYISVKSSDFNQKLTALATSGDMPDIFQNSFNMLPSSVDLDVCEDLTTLFEPEFLDKFEPHILKEGYYGDRLLYIPTQSMPAALLYRADWFEEKGLQAPETWDDLAAAAEKLTEDTDGDGNIDRYGFAMIGTKDSSAGTRFQLIMRSFGCREFYEEDGVWKTDVGNDDFKKAIQTFVDLDLVHHAAQPGVIETSYSEAANLVVANKAAMMLTGSNALGTIYSQNPDLKGKLASCAVPKGTEHVSSPRSLGYSVYNKGEHKEVCKDYLKFCMEKENNLKWTEISYRIPVIQDYYDEPILQNEDTIGFVDAIQYSYEYPQFLGLTKSYEIIGSVYQSLLTGSSDIDTASEKAKAEMEELIKSYE
ncbi:MAG: sugar ABC transporter substrate-binding protein [Lachnospiraceae bacterium]|nr:sugar ABC transporter substrate-binding protein [Lachnospiraceae bacterium]